MKIVFFGTPHFVIPVLEALGKNFEVVGVVTAPDEKTGRQQIPTPSPVKTYFKNNILTPEKLGLDFANEVSKLSPDLLVVAAYGKIIPLGILNLAKHGALNVHPSLLPRYRGASPIQQAILNGDKETGISVIKMDEKMDHGPVVYSQSFEIFANDTFASLSLRLFYESAGILPAVIKDFAAGKIQLKTQDEKKATFCHILKKENGYFDLSSSKIEDLKFKIERMARAYYPWPTAWTRWNGKILKFYPGGVIQIEGKNPVSYKDFINGYPDLDKNLLRLLR